MEELELKKGHEIKIDDNRLKIEMNNEEIVFTLFIGSSFQKYIRIFKHDEFRKEFDILDEIDLDYVYNQLKDYEYEINEKEKKVTIIIWKKDIKFEEEIKLSNEEMIQELINEINTMKKEKIELAKQIYDLDNIVNKYKNEIDLIYNTKEEGISQIFGDKLVKKNENNIELNINGEKSKLVSKYKLKKGVNNIKMIIKNKIKDLKYMFDSCKNLKNIDDLRYLNVKYCTDFSFMFNKCSSLKDIKPLENWNVSNGTNFSYMFGDCEALKDIKPLENWNLSNGTCFISMLAGCESLSNFKPLEKLNLEKDKINDMFNVIIKLKILKSD